MVMQRIYGVLKSLFIKERSSKKLATSFCVGAYIAFSPFMGLHTVMTFAFAWLFNLNLAATFTGSCLINNPWTMIPVYSGGYFFGDWLLHAVFGFDTIGSNPTWMACINEPLAAYVGLPQVSLWSFLLGGNLLGIVIGIGLYPVMNYLFTKISCEVSPHETYSA